MLLVMRQATAEKSRGLLGFLASTNRRVEGVCILTNNTQAHDYGFGVPTVERPIAVDDPKEAGPVILAVDDVMREFAALPTETLLVSETSDARLMVASLVLDAQYLTIEEVTQLYG